MSTLSVLERVRAFVSQEFLIEFSNKTTDETDLFGEDLIDSFSFVELLSFLETEFNIQLTGEEVASTEMRSLAGIARLLEAHPTEKT